MGGQKSLKSFNKSEMIRITPLKRNTLAAQKMTQRGAKRAGETCYDTMLGVGKMAEFGQG